jgi:NADH-quinone oxidoreductase subunit L
VIAWIGALTALLAALIAVRQDDIKKVLAYSTVSQLGFMFMAVGVGAFREGIFHLVTHAFFKGLLFLVAGSVMHAMANRTDIWQMGGLRKAMPITFWTARSAWLAIAGVPPFAGFFSKDQILTEAYFHGYGASGSSGWSPHPHRLLHVPLVLPHLPRRAALPHDVHPHESPRSMTSRWWCSRCCPPSAGSRSTRSTTGPLYRFLEPAVGPIDDLGYPVRSARPRPC